MWPVDHRTSLLLRCLWDPVRCRRELHTDCVPEQWLPGKSERDWLLKKGAAASGRQPICPIQTMAGRYEGISCSGWHAEVARNTGYKVRGARRLSLRDSANPCTYPVCIKICLQVDCEIGHKAWSFACLEYVEGGEAVTGEVCQGA
jgi:hypothetical protein